MSWKILSDLTVLPRGAERCTRTLCTGMSIPYSRATGTMKICMGVRSRSNTDVVFTVRGAQGFLFGTPLVDEKRAADVRLALEGVLRQEHRGRRAVGGCRLVHYATP